MCLTIHRKEPNKKKVITAFKRFEKTPKGLMPVHHVTLKTKPAEVGRWIRSTRIGWHAYLTRYQANQNNFRKDVIRQVKLRNILGYTQRYWPRRQFFGVRALEMYIIPTKKENKEKKGR